MFVSRVFVCCVGRGLCDGLGTCSMEYDRVCVCVCVFVSNCVRLIVYVFV